MIFQLAFTIFGTLIIVLSGTIVLLNFARDGRLLQHTIVNSTATDASAGSSSASNFDFKSNPQQYAESEKESTVDKKVDYGEDIPPPKTGGKVEIIYHTGKRQVAVDIKSTLEAGGFTVTISKGNTDSTVKTTIIDYNDRKVGSQVQKILKAGKLIKKTDKNQKNDVSLILGSDYLP